MKEFLAKKEAEKLAKQRAKQNLLNVEDEESGDSGMLGNLYPNLSKGLNKKKKSNVIHPDLVEQLKLRLEV